VYGGLVQLALGRMDLAAEHCETSMRLDPVGPNRPVQILLLGMARFYQERFTETVALMRELVRETDHPGGYAYLAASYGHLGEIDAAQAAIARHRALSPLYLTDIARSNWYGPTHLKLFLDGIALAEGTTA
jgi:predicted Zn-dependent protease